VAFLDGSGGGQGRNVVFNDGEQFSGDRRNSPQLLYVSLSLFKADGFLGFCPVVPGGNLGVDLGSCPLGRHHVSRGGEGRDARSVADARSLDKPFSKRPFGP